MRKPLTDSLCAELAKDFKPFKVRRNGLKPLSGFKTSTTFKVISLRKNALHQWVVRFATSKHDWLAENFDMIVEPKSEAKRMSELSPKQIITGLTPSGYTLKGEFSHVDEQGFTWIKYHDTFVKLVAIESEPIQVKAQQIDDKLKAIDTENKGNVTVGHFDEPIGLSCFKVGDLVRCYHGIHGAFTIGKVESIRGFNLVIDDMEYNPQFCELYEAHPDNQTVNALVQYVSEHKESMSKESVLHFANLIGLIKLGAL